MWQYQSIQLAELDLLLESKLLEDDLGTRIVQMGNDLELTNLDTGGRADGTISGDEIRFAYSEQRMLGEFEVDIYEEYEGTVLNASRLAMTLEGSLTLEVQGQMVTLGVLCSYHGVRRG